MFLLLILFFNSHIKFLDAHIGILDSLMVFDIDLLQRKIWKDARRWTHWFY
jgi:hypothetical protein